VQLLRGQRGQRQQPARLNLLPATYRAGAQRGLVTRLPAPLRGSSTTAAHHARSLKKAAVWHCVSHACAVRNVARRARCARSAASALPPTAAVAARAWSAPAIWRAHQGLAPACAACG
jgi:hypothetical protein